MAAHSSIPLPGESKGRGLSGLQSLGALVGLQSRSDWKAAAAWFLFYFTCFAPKIAIKMNIKNNYQKALKFLDNNL